MSLPLSSAMDCFSDVLASGRDGAGRRGVPEKTFHDLDWQYLADAIQAQTSGEDAYELAGVLGILDTNNVERRRREVTEVQRLLDEGARVPLGAPPSLSTPLLRARKVDALEPDDLQVIAESLEITSRLDRFFSTRASQAPFVAEQASRLRPNAELASTIRGTFDATGSVKDEASQELGRLRRRVRGLRETIQERLKGFLQDPWYEGILQDDFVTLREERFVLPVKAGERGDLPGIVHGHSNSGATLFVEPEALIPLNNELQVARNDVRREELRILRELTAKVKRYVDELESNGDVIAYLDLTHACAAVALRYRGEAIVVEARADGEFSLRDARHPLLALREASGELEVVANDIRFGGDQARSLIVSGPNTGGKTVVLKTVGLFALMTRAGLPVPCHADSTMPLFQRVFTDIGDEQTVQGDLSTFSSHVRNIASFIDRVVPGTLVLLDELFAGTDPAQATTLGRALLLEIDRLDGWSVVTTHLEGLKSLAFEDPRFACASMGFDIEAFEPTYRLRAGLPGSSYAHRIAARLGLPGRIVEHAERLADSEAEVQTEQLLQQLEEAHEQVFAEKERIEALRREVERERERLREETEKARRQEDAILTRETRELKQRIRALRDQLGVEEARVAAIRSKDAESLSDEEIASLKEARRIVEKVQQRTSEEIQRERLDSGGRLDAADASQIARGARVFVTTYKQPGVVVEEPVAGEKVVVQMGPVRVNVPLDVLRLDDVDGGDPAGSSGVRVPRSRASGPVSQRVDLRGMRVDEALEQIEARIEESVLHATRSLTLIHGHGTGALKRAIRAHLPQVPYNLRFRAGTRHEGGDGVTVVELEES